MSGGFVIVTPKRVYCKLCLFWACYMLSFCQIPIAQFYHWACTHVVLGFLGPFHRFWAPLSHFILLGILDPFHRFWAPLSHLFSLGRPRPVCFPWASSALFLTSHHHGLLLNSLGFPGPIMLFLILGVLGLAINPLLSLFSLL